VQSFRNRLLQRGSPTGSQAQPANLLRRGLLSVHGSAGPARSLLQHGLPMGFQPPSGIHLLQCGVLHGLQGDSLPHHGLHHGLQGKTSAPAPGAPPPPSSALTLVSAELFLSHRLTPLSRLLCNCKFFPFLNMLSQRCYHRRWLARPWPAAGPSESQLALALSDTGEASSSFSQ